MKTANAKVVDVCEQLRCSIESYADGELDPGRAGEVEAHVLVCTECAAKVEMLQAVRASLKKKLGDARCPDVLRARMCSVIAHEKTRATEPRDTMGPKVVRLKYAVGLAAAAGVMFAMGVSRYAQHDATATAQPAPTDSSSALTTIDKLLEDLVALHANPIPPETTNPEELKSWDPLVGVPVRKVAFQPFDGRFKGARVYATADRRAAMLEYTVLGGHRVTVYVFNTRTVPMQPTQLEPRRVGPRPMLIGKMRGYSVAAAEKSGVGYALATDVDEDETEQMLASAVNQ